MLAKISFFAQLLQLLNSLGNCAYQRKVEVVFIIRQNISMFMLYILSLGHINIGRLVIQRLIRSIY